MKKIILILILLGNMLLTACAAKQQDEKEELQQIQTDILSIETTASETTSYPEASCDLYMMFCFDTEEEFKAAVPSPVRVKDYAISKTTKYYTPSVVPDGTNLGLLDVSIDWIGLIYETEKIKKSSDAQVSFYWLRTSDSKYLEAGIRNTGKYYAQKDGYYVSSVNDAITRIDWSDNGNVFIANVPKTWSWDEVKAFCTAKEVMIT